MKNRLLIALFVACIFTGIVSLSVPTHADDQDPFSLTGFVEILIANNVISGDAIAKARDYVALLERITLPDNIRTNNVQVSVSQLIEHSDRKYNHLEDIDGLVLLAKNASDERLTLHAVRGCQVTYQIYSEDGVLLYDSSKRPSCRKDETVAYTLERGQTRMFQISHKQDTFKLPPGEYRFILTYPEYGGGEINVTIL